MDPKQKINDIFEGYKSTADFKDRVKMEILFDREKYEKNLDDMWAIYNRGVTSQIVEYNKGLAQIKNSGLRVLRNSAGKHKIVLK